MKKIVESIKKNRISLSVFAAVLLLLILSSKGAMAQEVPGNSPISGVFGLVGVAVTTVVGIFAYLLTTVFGLALTAMAALLVQVAQYSNIIDVPAVAQGWIIIRDLCNMFFVLIFLIIAFATILRMENYSAKRLLPKLIIMAILINFSKTIFGLMIDFSQIVMLTFVVAFKNGGGWFMDAFRVQKWYSFNMSDAGSTQRAATQWSTVVAMVLSVFASAVALIMVIVILAVLVIRIVMLWIYTILSPFVFLGWAFPPVGKYTDQIWNDFIKQLIVGPVLAFFLWLALAFGTASSTELTIKGVPEVCAGVGAMFCGGELQKFVIMLGMMIGGLMTAQSVGGAGAKAAGWGMAKVKSGQAFAWKGTKGSADFLNRKQAVKTGFDLNPTRQLARIKSGFGEMERKDMNAMREKATTNLRQGGFKGMVTGFTATDWTENYLKGFLGLKGLRTGVTAWDGSKKMKNLRDDQSNYTRLSQNVRTETGHKKEMTRLSALQIDAHKKGDTKEATKLERKMQWMQDNKSKLVFDQEEIVAKKTEYANLAQQTGDKATRYKIDDFRGKQEIRAAQAEEAKKITSENEDELIVQFDDALANNNASLAAAIAKSLVKAGGMNGLLAKHGYNPKAGLSKTELAELKSQGKYDEIENKKGFNDFVRDIFVDRLKMSEENAFGLQSDMAGAAESTSHQYMVKTVNVRPDTGEFLQVDEHDRENTIIGERRKQENEGNIRKHNRLAYGGENVHSGKFEWSSSGLTTFIDSWSLVAKEIKQNRFNRSAASKVVEPEALKKLEITLRSAQTAGALGVNTNVELTDADKKAGKDQITKFIEMIKGYAETSTKEKTNTLQSIVDKNI